MGFVASRRGQVMLKIRGEPVLCVICAMLVIASTWSVQGAPEYLQALYRK